MYTDGISEALVGDNEFGENRIKAAIERHTGGGGQLLDAILADLARHLGSHPQTDDLTLVTARVLPQAPLPIATSRALPHSTMIDMNRPNRSGP